MNDLVEMEKRVAAAFADRTKLADADVRGAVLKAVHALDRGEIRVAEKKDGEWKVNAWVMQAVNLYFGISGYEVHDYGPFETRDKVPLKKNLEEMGVRVVPGAVVRYGSFVAPGAVVLPGFVNIGARVGTGTMVDTWATVGSCAQVGDNVHLAGGVGIGGVLEPPGARPNIIEDGCFIGSRCIIVEGTLVEEDAVLGANVVRARSSSGAAPPPPTRRCRSTRRCATSRSRCDGSRGGARRAHRSAVRHPVAHRPRGGALRRPRAAGAGALRGRHG